MTRCVKKYKKWLVVGLVAAIAIMATMLAFTPAANASDFRLLKLDEVSAQYNKYIQPNFNAYFPEQEKDGLSLEVDSTVAKYLFWNSTVHGISDDAGYRQIGLQMQVGIRVSRYVDLSVNHFSQHILDEGDAWGRHYPCENWIGVKVYFYRIDNKDSVF